MKTKALLLAAPLLLFTLTNLAVGQDHSEKPPHTIDIGVIIPMTGGWKEWGDRIQNALELFQQNESKSVKFNFHYQDEATCDSAKAIQGYKFLRATQNIKIFILGCMNGARAILPIAQKDNALLLSAGFQEEELFYQNTTLVNFALQISSEAELLAAQIEKANVKHLALFRSVGTDSFRDKMREYFARNKKVEIVYDQAFEGEETSLTSALLQAKSRHADGLFINLPERLLTDVLQSKKNLHLTFSLFSSYAIEWIAATNPQVKQLSSGLTFMHPVRAETKDFDQSFSKQFGATLVVTVYFIYDGLQLLSQAAHTCTEYDIQCLYMTLANDEWRHGYSGNFRIHHDGSIERRFEVKQLP